MDYDILALFSAWFVVLYAFLSRCRSLEQLDEDERLREAHIRRLERECGLEEYPWGRA